MIEEEDIDVMLDLASKYLTTAYATSDKNKKLRCLEKAYKLIERMIQIEKGEIK